MECQTKHRKNNYLAITFYLLCLFFVMLFLWLKTWGNPERPYTLMFATISPLDSSVEPVVCQLSLCLTVAIYRIFCINKVLLFMSVL